MRHVVAAVIEPRRVIVAQERYKAVDVTQGRPQVMRDRVTERFDFAVERFKVTRTRAHSCLEVGAWRARMHSSSTAKSGVSLMPG